MMIRVSLSYIVGYIRYPHSISVVDSNGLLFSRLPFYLKCDPIYVLSIQTLLVLTHVTGQMPGG